MKVQRVIEGALAKAGAQTAKQIAASTGLALTAVRYWLWRAVPAGRVRRAKPLNGSAARQECLYTLRDPAPRRCALPGFDVAERKPAAPLVAPGGLLHSALASRTALEVSWAGRSVGANGAHQPPAA